MPRSHPPRQARLPAGARATLLALALALPFAAFGTTMPDVTPNRFFTQGAPARLEQAIRADDAAAVKEALAQGAAIDARGPHQVTPLMIAVDAQKLRAVEALLAGGARPDLAAADGASATSLAIANYRQPPVGASIVAALFRHGASPDQRGPNGDPVIMQFVNTADCEGLKMMKSAGANLDIRARNGDPILLEAAGSRDWDVVWCLIELGAAFDYEHGGAHRSLVRSLDNLVPPPDSPLYAYKRKVWQFLKDKGLPVVPMRN